MDVRLARRTGLVLATVLLPLTAGCACGGDYVEVGELVEESRTVELGDAESVEVVLETAIGEFEIVGGARNLLDAEFAYNVPQWKPVIEYHTSGAVGNLVSRKLQSVKLSREFLRSQPENRYRAAFGDSPEIVGIECLYQVGAEF